LLAVPRWGETFNTLNFNLPLLPFFQTRTRNTPASARLGIGLVSLEGAQPNDAFRAHESTGLPCHLESAGPQSPTDSRQPANAFFNEHCKALPKYRWTDGCYSVGLVPLGELHETLNRRSGALRTLFFWGDSLMNQIYVALGETLAQAAAHASGSLSALSLPPCGSSQGTGVGVAASYDQPFHAGHPGIPECTRNESNSCFRYGAVRLCYIKARTYIMDEHQIHSGWEDRGCFLRSGRDDIHIFNLGIWHNSRIGMETSAHKFARLLKATSQEWRLTPKTVWMESLPQHFSTKDGSFDPKAKSCLKVKEVSSKHGAAWRNEVAIPALQQELRGSPNSNVTAVFVGAWHALQKHAGLHVLARRKVGKRHTREYVDCTHWCHYTGSALHSIAHVLISDVARVFWQQSKQNDC